MITVKEEWLTDDKTKRAIAAGGYEVVAMWLALKRYCAEHLTDGFIPDEDIDSLPGAPPKPRKALEALVSCGRKQRDGTRSPGFVVEVEHGWQMHKYLEHANSREQEEQRRAKARTRKERFQERRSERVPEEQPNGVPSEPENGVPSPSGTSPPARGRAHAPSPAQPSPEDQQQSASDSDLETPIPMNFELHPSAVASLSKSLGFSEAVILEAAREFVGYWTIGGGMGQKRDHWQRRCRDDIRRKKDSGKLADIAKQLGASSAPGEDAESRRQRAAEVEARAKALADSKARERGAQRPQ
jgi:hypothetical protein